MPVPGEINVACAAAVIRGHSRRAGCAERARTTGMRRLAEELEADDRWVGAAIDARDARGPEPLRQGK
jgi:hypothetical protein